MADILIRGMEMPESCRQCRISFEVGIGEYLCQLCTDPNPCVEGGEFWRECGADGINTRPDWCPLIALPDGHGRLIDADKLMKHYAWWGECEQKDLFDSIVEQQDTIVPAEKEDT